MKKLLKYCGYTLLLLISLLLIYLIAAFCLSRMTVSKEPGTAAEMDIYIKTNGVHTDIVVPVKNKQYDWSSSISYTNTIAKDSTLSWLAFGWGNRKFFLETPQWSDLKAYTAFNAAFGLGKTAMHATFYRLPEENNSCKKISISYDQYARLTAYLLKSLQQDSSGHFISIKTTANYGNNDAFYEATGSYSMFNTCNSWANKALKACGQKACVWTAFDTPIFLKYK